MRQARKTRGLRLKSIDSSKPGEASTPVPSSALISRQAGFQSLRPLNTSPWMLSCGLTSKGCHDHFPAHSFSGGFFRADHEAAQFVKAMATRFQSEVTLLHVAGIVPAWYGATETATLIPVVGLNALMEELRQRPCRHLSNELAGLWIKRLVELGDPRKGN